MQGNLGRKQDRKSEAGHVVINREQMTRKWNLAVSAGLTRDGFGPLSGLRLAFAVAALDLHGGVGCPSGVCSDTQPVIERTQASPR